MNVNHDPYLDTESVVKHYSEKDGVPIKYVCTSALDTGTNSMDIFYRSTPHPEFGNRYFGLYFINSEAYITNADVVEELDFEMVEVDGRWYYSRDRHDFYSVGDVAIDGGRAYLRLVGNLSHPTKTFKVKDGEFIENCML